MKKIFAGGRKSVFVRGDSIDVNSKVFYIEAGTVGLYSTESSKRSLLFTYHTGEIFPYTAQKNDLLSGRNLEYRCLSTVSALSVSREKFDTAVFRPENIKDFVEKMTETMETQIDCIDNLERGQIYQRLLERLNLFARKLGVKYGDKIIIETPMSHSDIASSIGTSRETVNRIMKRLEKSGLISLRKQIIVINSAAALDRLIAQRAGSPTKTAPLLVIILVAAILQTPIAALFLHGRRNYRSDIPHPVRYHQVIYQ